METPANNQEKDLKDLMIYLVRILKKRLALVAIIFVIMGGVSIFKTFFAPEGEFINNTVILNSRFSKSETNNIVLETAGIELLTSLSEQIENKDYDWVSDKLNLETAEVKMIDELEIVALRDSKGSFTMNISFFAGSDAEKITNAVVNYLNNNEFISLNSNVLNERDQALLNDVNVEIETLKSTINQIIESGNSLDGLAYLYPRLSELTETRNLLMYDLKIGSPYYLLEKSKPMIIRSSILAVVLKYVAYATFLSIAVIMLLETIVLFKSVSQKQ